MPKSETTYCFDTSAFIDAWRRYYFPDLPFCKPVWERVEELMAAEGIIIHEEVMTELKDKDDDIYKFAKKYPNIVRKTTDEQVEIVSKILSTHGQLIDKAKTQKNHADAWVIALAKCGSAAVVTFEGHQNGFGIPAVCKPYKVRCLSFQEFLRAERVELAHCVMIDV